MTTTPNTQSPNIQPLSIDTMSNKMECHENDSLESSKASTPSSERRTPVDWAEKSNGTEGHEYTTILCKNWVVGGLKIENRKYTNTNHKFYRT